MRILIRILIEVKSWIRIRIKVKSWIRIRIHSSVSKTVVLATSFVDFRFKSGGL